MIELLEKYFQGQARETIVTHGSVVAALALNIGRRLLMPEDELLFLEQAALLHDIGVSQVYAPGIGLFGSHPYIMHGVLGREILEAEGLPVHALVCERHIGVGLTVADIVQKQLPLPLRDMGPQNLVEEIVCFADLFYSKKPGKLEQIKSPDKVRKNLEQFGAGKVQIFDAWLKRFGSAL